ncbi:uncharacterized protein BDR25DRAFT_355135 [Lindgomyces ingoldianus]|uniref:Uncharacterized protein n=1 Tax=Lindgomyces ingoldianus TaxID=673940 RepID=A0ACB6QUU7_9PLEO|nr:uncharacterized protein BDR25DRAFT_355135 [Lindgomyces ingoldianus]KAF2470655.1 hypothetical protein BDR25DRAFT_355135 [Lindgomyces ingoldianus]
MPYLVLIPHAKSPEQPYVIENKAAASYLQFFSAWGWPICSVRLNNTDPELLAAMAKDKELKRQEWRDLWKEEVVRRWEELRKETKERRKREKENGERVCDRVLEMQRAWAKYLERGNNGFNGMGASAVDSERDKKQKQCSVFMEGEDIFIDWLNLTLGGI